MFNICRANLYLFKHIMNMYFLVLSKNKMSTHRFTATVHPYLIKQVQQPPCCDNVRFCNLKHMEHNLFFRVDLFARSDSSSDKLPL